MFSPMILRAAMWSPPRFTDSTHRRRSPEKPNTENAPARDVATQDKPVGITEQDGDL